MAFSELEEHMNNRTSIGAFFCLFLISTMLPASAADDPTRCPVSQAMMDANYSLDQANVSIEPSGSIVTCRYKTTNSNIPPAGIGMQARCPDTKVLRSPGFIIRRSVFLQALVATPLASGESVAEIVVEDWVAAIPKQIAVLAYCS
jgi:hypothetical protein